MKKIERSYIREILDAINDKTISFAGGLPNEELFPLEEIKVCTNKVLSNSNSLQYSKSQGLDSLREKIAELYTKNMDFPTTKDEILITTGSQQAFDIIVKTFLKDDIIVQKPTYLGALGAFKILGANIKGFKDAKSLESKAAKGSLAYIMSDFSNPTSLTLDKIIREDIAKIINKKESILVEDGAYSFLNFDGKINKPISALCKNSFHLGSFSKIVAPGLRVGYIRAKKEYIDQILACKETLDLHTPTLNQMIIDKYLEDFNLFKHLEKIRKNYKNKMKCMASCFRKYIPNFVFDEPKGGMFIYGKFDEDSFELAKKALKEDIAFVPASVFYHTNESSNYARFNFTNSSNEKIEEGIIKLSKLLK